MEQDAEQSILVAETAYKTIHCLIASSQLGAAIILISEWINTPRGTCPTCRDIFLFIPEPSEEESSDGGEYIPGSDLTDDFMDEDYWSDEEDWIESEADLFEGHSQDESNSSWNSHIDETSAPAHGQLICIDEPSDIVPSNVLPDLTLPHSLMDELVQLKAAIDSIQPDDLLVKKEQVNDLLNMSLSRTKEMKRILDTQECPPSHLQSIVKSLEEIDVRMQSILTMTLSNRD
ncbi:hypothetical protein Clacol_001796 [Clathrus columnatus]|uniref:Uncharacterized protein n=1 Tax=Clathrus columnatus TaxID=1419009 RepID=A0AAV5A275_9AGAM|nr:hypothetical protein Clacol_001796 [Clathrus columnatus]